METVKCEDDITITYKSAVSNIFFCESYGSRHLWEMKTSTNDEKLWWTRHTPIFLNRERSLNFLSFSFKYSRLPWREEGGGGNSDTSNLVTQRRIKNDAGTGDRLGVQDNRVLEAMIEDLGQIMLFLLVWFIYPTTV